MGDSGSQVNISDSITTTRSRARRQVDSCTRAGGSLAVVGEPDTEDDDQGTGDASDDLTFLSPEQTTMPHHGNNNA